MPHADDKPVARPFGHRRGARVARQRCPILRDGAIIVLRAEKVFGEFGVDAKEPFMDSQGCSAAEPLDVASFSITLPR